MSLRQHTRPRDRLPCLMEQAAFKARNRQPRFCTTDRAFQVVLRQVRARWAEALDHVSRPPGAALHRRTTFRFQCGFRRNGCSGQRPWSQCWAGQRGQAVAHVAPGGDQAGAGQGARCARGRTWRSSLSLAGDARAALRSPNSGQLRVIVAAGLPAADGRVAGGGGRVHAPVGFVRRAVHPDSAARISGQDPQVCTTQLWQAPARPAAPGDVNRGRGRRQATVEADAVRRRIGRAV